MKKNKLFFGLVLFASNILFFINAFAQPYKYNLDFIYNPQNNNTEQKIYRVNLRTGELDTVISDRSGLAKFLLNPSQTKLFLEDSRSGDCEVIDPEMPDSTLKIFYTHGGTISGVLDGPDNTMYVSGWFGYYDGDTVGLSGSYIINRNTLTIIDSTSISEIDLRQDLAIHGFHNNLSSFLSSDKSNFYTFVYNDKTGIYFDVASTKTNRHIGRKRCGILGGFVYGPSIEDERNGYAIISYETSAGFAYQKYVVCNVDSGAIESIIPFTQRADVYLSADTKYTLIEEANWDPSAATRKYLPGEYIPGNIYVYESKSGKLIQRLALPPQGEVLLFDNYPNMLYYYLPVQHRSINIDLSKLTSINSLNPTTSYTGSSNFTITISGKNFTSSSIVNWNGTAKSTTFIADSILQASILASDIAVVDSPLVTVKNPDGSESNSIRFYIKQQPVITGYNVKLINSNGTKLTTGSLQYYDGVWKDAINNNDGTFFINTTAKTLSLRMTYEYGTQTKSNVSISTDTIVFQTVNAQIQLQNSNGALIDTGTVQYYAGAWRTLGTTINGVAVKELLPASYSFRMTYANASKDKQQDIGANATIIFKTVNAQVQLQNSSGALMDTGSVQYYSGSWLPLGTTINGVATKELLPNSYSFRMSYAYASKDLQQNIDSSSIVIFKTVNTTVQLQNSQGSFIDTGVVQYYSGAWRAFGSTINGVSNKELLPNSYSFRMYYASASKDKQQDIGASATVIFQTVQAQVQLQNSQGTLIDTGIVQYYSGAWRSLGTTTSGTATKELLPNSYSFRMTYALVSLDKTQDLSSDATVRFSTVLCTIRVKNSQSQLVDNALASYYSGAWKQIGNTVNGVITKELLPVSLSFRVKYGTQQIDKTQNLSTNNVVDFVIQ